MIGYGKPFRVGSGGLISLNHLAIVKPVVSLADLILQDAEPQELPLETAEFDLVIKLKTAEAGLSGSRFYAKPTKLFASRLGS